MSVRPDVARAVRAVSWLVATKFAPRSVASQWAIHESRLGRKGAPEIDVAEASAVEIIDAICLAELRRKLYARPTERTDVVYEDGPDKGKPMRPVATRRVLARTVRVKPSRTYSFGASGVQGRRLQIASCLGKLPRAWQEVIIQVAEDVQERLNVWNQLQQARSEAERVRGGSRRARLSRSLADAKVLNLASQESALNARITANIEKDEYRGGVAELARIFASSPDIEREVFGEDA